jgi:hypothetical protein
LSDAELLRLKSRFNDKGKDRVSRQLATMKGTRARVQLAAFEALIAQLSAYLVP